MSDTTMTMTLHDGTSTGPFTLDDLKAATGKLKGMKNTPEDDAVSEGAYRVTARELRSFVERYERLEAEKRDISDQMKEVLAEARARGYDTKVLRKLIALRKRDSAEVAEEEALLTLYREALGC